MRAERVTVWPLSQRISRSLSLRAVNRTPRNVRCSSSSSSAARDVLVLVREEHVVCGEPADESLARVGRDLVHVQRSQRALDLHALLSPAALRETARLAVLVRQKAHVLLENARDGVEQLLVDTHLLEVRLQRDLRRL